MRSKGEQDSLTLLLNSKIDYFLMDELVVQYLVASYPEEARTRLAIGTIPLHTRSVHLSLHRSLPDAGAIIKGFNTQLRAMIADRTYHRLLHVNWIRADVDGDGQVEYVSDSDQAGKAQPERAYNLFSLPPMTTTPARRRKNAISSAVRSTTAGRRCPTSTRSIISIAQTPSTRRRGS